MTPPMIGLWAFLLVTPPPIETRFEQLTPASEFVLPVRRSEVHRAVVLLHGLRVQPVSVKAVQRAEPSFWECPDAPLIQALSKHSDVYGFHYAQSTPVDEIARHPALSQSVRRLREAGYSEIVLVGYSAGGIIARQFAELEPHSGITKVVQVCTPNGGSDWSFLVHGVRAAQAPFIRSLNRDHRGAIAQMHGHRRIPAHIEFVCLVAVTDWFGDGVVRRDSQWPADLQAQGIPAETIYLPHVGAMYSGRLASRVSKLVDQPQPRWSSDQVKDARPKILGAFSWR